MVLTLLWNPTRTVAIPEQRVEDYGWSGCNGELIAARKRKARLGERAFGERRKLENGKNLPLLFLGWLFRCHN